MKSQTSTEYIVILAVVFLLIGLVLVFVYDVPGLLVSGEDAQNSAYWRRAPVGIAAAYGGDFNTTVYVINNHREEITILNISVNDVFYEITENSSSTIQSGEVEWFVLDEYGFESASHRFSFVYNINGIQRNFSGLVPLRVQ